MYAVPILVTANMNAVLAALPVIYLFAGPAKTLPWKYRRLGEISFPLLGGRRFPVMKSEGAEPLAKGATHYSTSIGPRPLIIPRLDFSCVRYCVDAPAMTVSQSITLGFSIHE